MQQQRILIIDDDDRNIFALTAVLRAKGYQCISANSARDGLQALRNQPGISIVLADMMMPDMDGYEMIAEIRKDPAFQHLPLIAVTAQAMIGDKEKCLAAGADGYVSKPINIDTLLSVVKDTLSKKPERPQ
ncbi:MAG: response regulator [Ferruginibacter sp.]|nr:response regulator [Ferruginibacter sp.]